MTQENNHLQPPERSGADTAHMLVRAAMSAVPYVGGPAVELFNHYVPSSLERRRQDWYDRIADVLQDLQAKRGINVEDLAGDETFITVLVEASRAALGSHLEEKLDLLAKCVESAALPENRNDFIAMRYLRYVEELSPEHFVVLTYLADPYEWYDRHGIDRGGRTMGPQIKVLERAQIGIDGDALQIVLADLDQRGLANTSELSGMVSDNAQFDALVDERGRMLLEFIRAV